MKNHHEKPSKNHGKTMVESHEKPSGNAPHRGERRPSNLRVWSTEFVGHKPRWSKVYDLPIGEAGWPVDNNGYILLMVNNG